jgi:hypothetical protein
MVWRVLLAYKASFEVLADFLRDEVRVVWRGGEIF